MTRKEQVTNKVKEIVHESGYNAIPSTLFEMAAWADKTMIEKACEWIQKEVLEDYPYIIWPDIVKDFRKAMEE